MKQASPPPQLDPNQGKVLAGTYQLRRLLGEGGMGRVYEAGHLRLSKKRYAVKLLNAGAADDEEAYARFRREAEIATEIGHPHIVEVHDFNITDEGHPFMVMEFLDGQDLYEHIKANRRLPPAEVARIMDQVASALRAAHDRGVVHRDLKPENIFLTRTPESGFQVKLLDFGLSKIKHSRSRLTRQNAIFGTPQYMAPEQARGKTADVDHRADIFALGVIVYQCLSGKVPFDAPTDLGVLYTVCTETPEPLTKLVGLPPDVDAILSRAMAKQMEDRYQDVRSFVDDLVRVLDIPERADDTAPLLQVPSKPQPRVSAGVIEGSQPKPQPEQRQPTLPPGAPPLPQEALEDDGARVVVSPSLAPGQLRRPSQSSAPKARPEGTQPRRPSQSSAPKARPGAGPPGGGRPGIHNLETARKRLKRDEPSGAPSIHDLQTTEASALPPTAPYDIHDLSTGEVQPIAAAPSGMGPTNEDGASVEETLPRPLADESDMPRPISHPAQRQRTIAVTVFIILLTLIGVTAAWFVSQV